MITSSAQIAAAIQLLQDALQERFEGRELEEVTITIRPTDAMEAPDMTDDEGVIVANGTDEIADYLTR